MFWGPKSRNKIESELENKNPDNELTEENLDHFDIEKLSNEFSNNEMINDLIDLGTMDFSQQSSENPIEEKNNYVENENSAGSFFEAKERIPRADQNQKITKAPQETVRRPAIVEEPPKRNVLLDRILPPAPEPEEPELKAPTESNLIGVEGDIIYSPIIDNACSRPVEIIGKSEAKTKIYRKDLVEFHQNTTQAQFDGYIANNRYIRYLDLSFAYKLDNVDILANMESLEQLDLTNLNITDFRFLATLPNLRVLVLNNTEIVDLSPLRNMTELEYLGLVNTKVRDLSPLSGLYNIKEINFFGCNNVSSLQPISELTDMRNLDLELTTINDMSPVARFTKLTGLCMDNCVRPESFEFLKNLVDLRYLSIQSDGIMLESDLEYFFDMRKLNVLFLPKKGISTLKYFANMRDLKEVLFSDNYFSDLSPLENITGMLKLKMSGVKNLVDLSPLYKMSKLGTLELNGSKKVSTNISDFSVLKYLQNLDTFESAFNYALKDISPIIYCEKMEQVNLTGCMNLENVDVLKYLQKLWFLNVSLCPKIRDLSCVRFIPNLKSLDFNGTLVATEKLVGICKRFMDSDSYRGNDAGIIQMKTIGSMKRRNKLMKSRRKYEKLSESEAQ